MLPSSPTTTTSLFSLFSLFFLTILPTLTSALPTPLSPTTSDVDVEIIAPALQFLPQRAVPLTQGMETEMSMVTIREETSDEEGSDDAGPDCKFLEMWLGGEFGVVISWEMMLKNSREKEKKKGEIG